MGDKPYEKPRLRPYFQTTPRKYPEKWPCYRCTSESTIVVDETQMCTPHMHEYLAEQGTSLAKLLEPTAASRLEESDSVGQSVEVYWPDFESSEVTTVGTWSPETGLVEWYDGPSDVEWDTTVDETSDPLDAPLLSDGDLERLNSSGTYQVEVSIYTATGQTLRASEMVNPPDDLTPEKRREWLNQSLKEVADNLLVGDDATA